MEFLHESLGNSDRIRHLQGIADEELQEVFSKGHSPFFSKGQSDFPSHLEENRRILILWES